MNIKQIFVSHWGFDSFFIPGSGACQRPCESFHLYKQTENNKKQQKSLRQPETFP